MAGGPGVWKAKAEKDLGTARLLFENKKFEESAFFCQQAVEKILKALYIKQHGRLEKTHDLVFLCSGIGAPEAITEMCKEIGPAYFYTRYPDVVEIPDMRQEADKILGYSKKVIEWAKKAL